MPKNKAKKNKSVLVSAAKGAVNSYAAMFMENQNDGEIMRDAIVRVKFEKFCNDIENLKDDVDYVMELPPKINEENLCKAFQCKKLNWNKIYTPLHKALKDVENEAFENGLLLAHSSGLLLHCTPPWKIAKCSVDKFNLQVIKSKVPTTSETTFELFTVKRNWARHLSLKGSDCKHVEDLIVKPAANKSPDDQDRQLINQISNSIKDRLKQLKSNDVEVILAVSEHFYGNIKVAMDIREARCDRVVLYDSFDEESIPMRYDSSIDMLPNKSIIDWKYLRRWRDAPEERKCSAPHVVEQAVRSDYVEEICIWKDLPLWRFEVENSKQDLVGIYYGNSSEIKDKYHYYEGDQRKQSEVLRMHHEEPFLDWLERHVDKYKIKFITSDLARDSDFVLINGGLQALLSPDTNVEQLEASASERIR